MQFDIEMSAAGPPVAVLDLHVQAAIGGRDLFNLGDPGGILQAVQEIAQRLAAGRPGAARQAAAADSRLVDGLLAGGRNGDRGFG